MTATWVALIACSRINSNQQYIPCSLYQTCLVRDNAFKVAQYLVVDHPELSPLWRGILRSWNHQDGIAVQHAQVLVRWDPHYGFPLLHNYILTSDIIVVCYPFFMILLVYTLTGRWTGLRALTFSVEVACAPGTICQQSAHKYAVPSTIFSVDLVIVLFRVDNTCHRSCDLVTHHTLCCI